MDFVDYIRNQAYYQISSHVSRVLTDFEFGGSLVDKVSRHLASGITFFTFYDEDEEIEFYFDVNTHMLHIDLGEEDTITRKLDSQVGSIITYAYHVRQDMISYMTLKNDHVDTVFNNHTKKDN